MKKSEKNTVEIKKIYARYNDDYLAVRRIVFNICRVYLSNEDIVWLDKCIKAFLHKKSYRAAVDKSVRKALWVRQQHKCNICCSVLPDYTYGHVDHIIPWDYVGDELENNYQLLCEDCNYHKSNHIANTVRSLILNH